MNPSQVNIEASWQKALAEEFQKNYFTALVASVKAEIVAKKTIYPKGSDIFKAFNLTPFDKVKVVILGQDPYHNPNEAMGLCFSVPVGCKIPPSLKNVFKELLADVGKPIPEHGDLTDWANQGVLLLNAILTVEENKPGSHKNFGWQQFTDAVITTLSEEREGLVFMLWGNYAKSKLPLIDDTKHHILTAAHPSPLARFGFSDCRHFSKCNTILVQQQQTPIAW